VSKRGFTLIELMVVIAVLSLMAALVVPNLIARERSQAARDFFSALPRLAAQARLSAIQQQATTRMTYDSASRRIVVELEPVGPEEGRELASAPVPDGIEPGNMRTGNENSGSSDWQLRFYADGRSDGGGAEWNDAGRQRALIVDRDGISRMLEGNLPEAREERWPAGDYERRA